MYQRKNLARKTLLDNLTLLWAKNIANFVISELSIHASVTRIRSSEARSIEEEFRHVYCIFPRKISQGGKKSRPVHVVVW